MKRGLLLFAVAAALFALPVASYAEDEPDELYWNQSLGKLGRGIANVVTSPGEIIRMVEIEGREDGYLAGLTSGLLQGVGRTIYRLGAGVTEVLTFYTPWPNDFGPLIEPEYVFAHGSWSQRDY